MYMHVYMYIYIHMHRPNGLGSDSPTSKVVQSSGKARRQGVDDIETHLKHIPQNCQSGWWLQTL